MCTVSFYRGKEQVIITSNRDENMIRPHALPPSEIDLDFTTVYCPIDTLHHGTWFAVNKVGCVFVLLNGAIKKHVPNPPYKKSRGLVLLEIIDSISYLEKWYAIDLGGIENFTLVAYSRGKLAIMRWDGREKTHQYLDENKSHIWSSSTLYDELTRREREEWFYDFLNKKNKEVNSDDIIDFHISTRKEDTENGLIISRSNNILTKNVTQTILYPTHFAMKHWDLTKNEKTAIEKPFQ